MLLNPGSLVSRVLAALAVTLALGAPVWAKDKDEVDALPAPKAELGYHPVILGEDGLPEGKSLDELMAGLRRVVKPGETQVIVLVHGFGHGLKDSGRDFQKVSAKLRQQAHAVGLKTTVVGVHWRANAGTMGEWIPKAVAHRVTSLLGLKNVVKNPYLEKGKLAVRTGRTGLRRVVFRIQDELPKTPVHLFAHSMGSQLVVSALAPEVHDRYEKDPAVEQPGRTLGVRSVVLAGADLDHDLFARDSDAAVRAALHQADLWWITVPPMKMADGVLELRRGAGRGDALGNKGVKLVREDLEAILARRALVLDQEKVPVRHRFIDYFGEERARAIASTLLYLTDRTLPGAQSSVLARVDALPADPEALKQYAAGRGATVQLYAAWRLNPERLAVHGLKIVPSRNPVTSRTAGFRQETSPAR